MIKNTLKHYFAEGMVPVNKNKTKLVLLWIQLFIDHL